MDKQYSDKLKEVMQKSNNDGNEEPALPLDKTIELLKMKQEGELRVKNDPQLKEIKDLSER